MFAGRSEPKNWIILVERTDGARDRWVTADVDTLDDTRWIAGHYFTDLPAALADLYLRAIDRDELVRLADTVSAVGGGTHV
jgi:hypothetical protein